MFEAATVTGEKNAAHDGRCRLCCSSSSVKPEPARSTPAGPRAGPPAPAPFLPAVTVGGVEARCSASSTPPLAVYGGKFKFRGRGPTFPFTSKVTVTVPSPLQARRRRRHAQHIALAWATSGTWGTPDSESGGDSASGAIARRRLKASSHVRTCMAIRY